MGAIREIPMIIPPLAEQKAIVAKVKASFAHIEELESRSDILLEQIFNLDQSILTKAFQGELVPQDPNDESAAILLERIRAVRSTGTSLTKRQRQLSTG
jgi:type I restriction enzyme S subunit